LFFSPSVAEDENPVRPTQPRSGMLARSARSERLNPPPRGAFCFSRRVWMRKQNPVRQNVAAFWTRAVRPEMGEDRRQALRNNPAIIEYALLNLDGSSSRSLVPVLPPQSVHSLRLFSRLQAPSSGSVRTRG